MALVIVRIPNEKHANVVEDPFPDESSLYLELIYAPQTYPSQTKILEVRTNLSECVFEALFKGVSTRFGRRIVEKCFENAFGKVGSDFQNLRLGGV